MNTTRLLRLVAGAVVLYCLLLASHPVSAGEPGAEFAVLTTAGAILELYLIIAVPIYAFTNLSYAIDNERPPQSWITFGLVGVGHFVLGALDIGMTIWASQQPEKQKPKLTLAPIVMPDARGNAAFGIGLRLVDW